MREGRESAVARQKAARVVESARMERFFELCVRVQRRLNAEPERAEKEGES